MSSPPRLSRDTPVYQPAPVSPLPLYMAAFLLDIGVGMIAITFPWIAASRFHASAQTIGLVNGIATGLYTAVALCSGALARRFSPFSRIMAGSFGPAIAYGLVAASGSLPQLAAALCCSWLFMGGFWPALQTQLVNGCTPEEIQRRVTRFNLSWSLGIMLGPAIAGQLYSLGPRLPFATACAAAVLAAIVAAVGLRRFASLKPAPTLQGSGLLEEQATPVRNNLFLYAAWCAHFGSYFCSANIRSFFPLLASAHAVPVRIQGYLVLELGAFQTATFFLMSYAHRWVTRRRTYIVGMGLVAAGMLLTARSSEAFFITAFVVTGVGMGITYVLSLYHSLHSTRAARNSGIHEGIVGGSGIFGAMSGGYAGSHFGLRTPFYLGAATVFLAMLLASLFLSRIRSRS